MRLIHTVMSTTKVTSMHHVSAAAARPYYDPNTKTFWDSGNAWIMLLPKEHQGTNLQELIEPKPYNIDDTCYRDLILDKLLPAIADKYPIGMKAKPIFIQHGNAPPHKSVCSTLPALLDKNRELGITVIVQKQLSNSLDLNLLDLGVFHVLQSH